jgi:hypothetical protein
MMQAQCFRFERNLKSAGRKAVGVQVPLWAPSKQRDYGNNEATWMVAFLHFGALLVLVLL